MGIDRHAFDNQLEASKKKKKLDEQTKLSLYALASIVSYQVKHSGVGREDLVQDIWIGFCAAWEKYDPKTGSAFGFFYQCGMRTAFAACRTANVRVKREENNRELKGRLAGIAAAQPMRLPYQCKPKVPKDPVSAIDRVLRKIKKTTNKQDASTAEYQYAAAGASWLQQVRHSVTGEYLTLKMQTCGWTRTTVTGREPK